MSNNFKIFHAPPPAEVLKDMDRTSSRVDPIIEVKQAPTVTHQGRQRVFTYKQPKDINARKVHGDNGSEHAEGHLGPAIQVLLDPKSPKDILI